MEPDVNCGDIGEFLSAHKPVEISSAFAPGDVFGDWRVTAFLGRGGSGEVYRVVHATLGTEAALKVLVRDDERAKVRFEREARLLAGLKSASFPRFFAYGEKAGSAYIAMELLEPGDMPAGGRAVAKFMLQICEAVGELHALGYIHRDIKPGNILWRLVGSRVPVLADLGLVKEISNHPTTELPNCQATIGGVGTPRYAAPEQMVGDEVSPATDVYALGMLANDCFGGKPPRAWQRIIQRATAAIPAQRYATVDAFVRAVKLLRARSWIVGALVAAMAVSAIALWMFSAPPTAMPSVAKTDKPPTESEVEETSWRDLSRAFTTNVMTWHTEVQPHRILPDEYIKTPANAPRFGVKQWAETNKINAVQVNLDGRTIAFSKPLDLEVGREYWIVGPGVLDAQFSALSTATVHIANCIFRNRTATSPRKAGINYVLDGGAYLNFTELSNTEAMKVEVGSRIRVNGMSEGRRWWRIKGANDIFELVDEDNKSPVYSATLE